jgi:RNA polymerase sigma-70 factor (ECF subfamily)
MNHHAKPSDAELMARAQAGDTGAFSGLIERHRDRVERFLFRLCWDEEEARDGAQEVFVRLWLGRREYVEQGAFVNCLYVVGRNWWRNRVRALAARPRVVPLVEQLGEAGRRKLAETIAAAEPAEATVLRRWDLQRTRLAISRLPEAQRMVLILGHLEGLSQQQVADILEIPVGTVKSRMHHALRRLHSMLEEPKEADSDAL